MLDVRSITYLDLERLDTPQGRFYLTPDGPAPSVTTILSKTSDNSWLKEWRASVGDEEANRLSTIGSTIGTEMHNALELLMTNRLLEEPVTEYQITAHRMAKAIKTLVFKNKTIKCATEVKLHYGSLYAGTTDLVLGDWNNEEAIIDYKSCSAFRDKDTVDKHATQISAYGLAHNWMYGTDIRTAVVIQCTRQCNIKVSVYRGDDYDAAANRWADAVERFYAK
jgi:hypothetical protein